MVEQLAATVHICLQQKGQQLWTKAKLRLSTLLCLLWKAPKCSSASEAATASSRLWGEGTLQHWGVQRSLWGSSDCPKAAQPGCLGLQADIPQVPPPFCFCFAKCSLKQVRAEKWCVGPISGFSLVLSPAGSDTLPSDCSSLGPGNRVGTPCMFRVPKLKWG